MQIQKVFFISIFIVSFWYNSPNTSAQIVSKSNIPDNFSFTNWGRDTIAKNVVYFNVDTLVKFISKEYIDSIILILKNSSGIVPSTSSQVFFYKDYESLIRSNIALHEYVNIQSLPLIYNNKILIYDQGDKFSNSNLLLVALIANSMRKLSHIKDDNKLEFFKAASRKLIINDTTKSLSDLFFSIEKVKSIQQIDWGLFLKAIANTQLQNKTLLLPSTIRNSITIKEAISNTYEITDTTIISIYNRLVDSIRHNNLEQLSIKIRPNIPYFKEELNSMLNQSWYQDQKKIFSIVKDKKLLRVQTSTNSQYINYRNIAKWSRTTDSTYFYTFISSSDSSGYQFSLSKKTFSRKYNKRIVKQARINNSYKNKQILKIEATSDYNLRFENQYNPTKPIHSYLGNANNELLKGYYQRTFRDIFENYKFGFEFSIPINFSGSGFTLFYNNYKRRLDWGGFLNRNVEKVSRTNFDYWLENFNGIRPDMIKVRNHIIQLHALYPLSYNASIKLAIRIEQNKTFFPATTESNLNLASLKQSYFSGNLGYQRKNIKYYRSKYNPISGSELNTAIFIIRNNNSSQTAKYFQINYDKYINIKSIGVFNINLNAQKKLGKNNIIFNSYATPNNIIPAIDTNLFLNNTTQNITQVISNNFRGAIQNQIISNQYISASFNLESFQFEKITTTPVLKNFKIGIWFDNILSHYNRTISYHFAFGPSLSLNFTNKSFKLNYCVYNNLHNKNIIYLSIFL